MATILPAVRAAQAKARYVSRASALATGMAGVLDMGAQLAAYRHHLVHALWNFAPQSLDGDWAALERDATKARERVWQDRSEPVPSQ